jgi:hypothetical protein
MEPRNQVWGLKGIKGAPESLVLQDIPLPKLIVQLLASLIN